ncbi:ribosome maturation factor RimP [Cellulomonas bogoriensis]|uniref:Ribosome maturation factor RimP n=1 Tax=Cellulomonas bogoriensis 69B4 = DSM 16987 TaxID=1386082 RepID=A0A0A0C2B1_9CELL|nr:ribosome maturation factor [Cellulomonas bogoriensis]KGM14132.1 ribosome maturation factor RimP [Cellulomonas bogoriensis 69B4 = DSM 16987]
MVTAAAGGAAPRVREVVAPVVDAAGLHLEDVTVSAAGRRSVVRVVVDLTEDAVGSLDLDALGEVSREVSAVLDARDPVRGAYVLEVSTPGTDRPLTEPRHFRRARTRLVRLVMVDGSDLLGRLVDASAEAVELELSDGRVTRVPMVGVRRGHVEVELTRVGDEEEQA